MAFFHGVEISEVALGSQTITAVNAAVIGLVGIAPKGPTNKLVMVTGDADLAQFGVAIAGFSIPQALAAIIAEKGSTVIVTNVFNATTMTEAVVTEAVALTGGVGKTAFGIISDLVVKNTAGTTTFILNTDYRFTDAGQIEAIPGGAMAALVSVNVAYKKFKANSVTAADIIGTVDGVTGARTGMKLWDTAINRFGLEPRLLGAPGFSHLPAVTTELVNWAREMKSFFVADVPPATSVQVALDGRTPSGTINSNVFDEYGVFMMPGQALGYNSVKDAYELQPHSQFALGAMSRNIVENGYWISPSNTPYLSVKGFDVEINGSAFSNKGDAHKLNSVGYLTVLNEGLNGITLWGNRNSLFPKIAGITTFITSRMVRNVLLRSVQFASRPFLGKQIDQFTIDSIAETVNSFIRTLIARRALLPGSICVFDKSKNPDQDMLNGRLCFTIKHLNGPTLEDLAFDSVIDLSLISAII